MQMTQTAANKGKRTRQAVLEAAYSLFIEQGYHATSMRQIAARSGLALGGIYNHFPSKEQVFRQVLFERHPYRQIVPALAAAQGETAGQFVRSAARAMVDELGHHPEFVNLMLVEIVEFKGRHVPEIFQFIFPQILVIARRFAGLEGDLRPIPAPLLLRAFLGMFFSYYMTELLIGSVMPDEMRAESLDVFVDIFLHGVLRETEPA
jgi:AcrR family transcriptional regulator